ncbi:hypothetical protein ES705_38831 [subsurface metagenome]
MPDPVFVLDEKNCIINFNPAAKQIMKLPIKDKESNVGAKANVHQYELLKCLNARVEENGEVVINEGKGQHYYDMLISPVVHRKKTLAGNILVLHDNHDNMDEKRVEKDNISIDNQGKINIETTTAIQLSLLPRAFPQIDGINFDRYFKPYKKLAGDIFNVFRLNEEHIALYILDISGHGVVASLLSFALSRLLTPLPDQSSLLKQYSDKAPVFRLVSPVEVAESLNRQFPINHFRHEKINDCTDIYYGGICTKYTCMGFSYQLQWTYRDSQAAYRCRSRIESRLTPK